MRTHNVIGIYNGNLPDAKGPAVQKQTVKLDASGNGEWDAQGGGGSSVYATDAFQTAFVDNAAGANNLTIKCVGTNFSFIVPKGTQGYYPLVCAVGGYGFSISGGVASQEIDISIFNIMLPTYIWTIV